jgi:hypothetical protein
VTVGGKSKACYFCPSFDKGVATFELRRFGEDEAQVIRAHHGCVRKARRHNPKLIIHTRRAWLTPKPRGT